MGSLANWTAVEERICKLEDRVKEIIQTEMKEKKKSERHRTKHPNTEIMYQIV